MPPQGRAWREAAASEQQRASAALDMVRSIMEQLSAHRLQGNHHPNHLPNGPVLSNGDSASGRLAVGGNPSPMATLRHGMVPSFHSGGTTLAPALSVGAPLASPGVPATVGPVAAPTPPGSGPVALWPAPNVAVAVADGSSPQEAAATTAAAPPSLTARPRLGRPYQLLSVGSVGGGVSVTGGGAVPALSVRHLFEQVGLSFHSCRVNPCRSRTQREVTQREVWSQPPLAARGRVTLALAWNGSRSASLLILPA